MKAKLLLLFISIVILAMSAFGASKSSKGLYNEIKDSYQKNYPEDFVASVSGAKIKSSLKEIPRGARCRGKRPKVTYLFLKGEAESIIVENVENPFVTRFQAHLEVYKNAKSFLDSGKSFAQLQKTYYWKYLSSKSDLYYVIKMRKHRLRKSDFMLLYVDKKNLSLKKVVQYSGNKLVGTVNVTYRKVKKYLLPSLLKFNVKLGGRRRREQFTLRITNYRVNVDLSSDDIIDLQDDCPSLKKVLEQ